MTASPSGLAQATCATAAAGAATAGVEAQAQVEGGWPAIFSRYSETLAQQGLTAGLGVVSGILAPRLLGPQGRGELAAVTLWPLTLIFLGTLGVDRASVFFAAKGRQDSSPVASACLTFAGAESLLIVLAGLVVIPMALRSYGREAVILSLIFLLSAPLIQTMSLGSSLLLGHLRLTEYNLARVIPPALYTLAVAALFVLGIPSVKVMVLAQVAGFALAGWLVVRLVLRRLRPRFEWSPATLKAMLKYGAKTHAGELGSFLNQRLDQLLISLFLPGAQLGIYVAAVAFADSLLIIPRGIGVVTLASGSNSESAGAWRWARRSLVLAVLWLVPASLGLWALSPFLIPHLFGRAFAPSVWPCRILVLGTFAMGLSTVLYGVARSLNRPEIPAYAEVGGLAVTAVLLALLLKPYGLMGAAIASSAAYIVTLAIAAGFVFSQRSGREL